MVSYNEFKQEKKNYELTTKEKQEIDKILIEIGRYGNVNTVTNEMLAISPKELDDILRLEVTNGFDFYDAFHVLVACKLKADCIISKDGPAITCMTRLKKAHPYKISILKPNDFIRQYL